MAGRKSKFTPERVKQITDAIAAGATHKDAYIAAGISHETFYQWIDTKPEFAESVTYAESRAHLGAVAAIRYAIQGHPEESTTSEVYTETRIGKDGQPYEHRRSVTKRTVAHVAPDWRAAIDYLKRRDPEHWSDKLNITLDFGMTPDKVNTILRILAEAGDASPGDTLEALAQSYVATPADTSGGEGG